MRPEGRGALESLYFNYPHFAAPDRARLPTKARVAIVGAGPVGMVAALTLAKYGIACTLIDAKDTLNDGSRAICVARSSFNTLRMLGQVEPFEAKSLPYLSGRTFFRGRQILEFVMPDSEEERYRPMYNIQQQFIEQYLYDGVAAEPLIDMRWQTECFRLTDTDGTVSLRLRDPAGDYALEADWVLAADGARSPVRKMRGKRLKGKNFEGRYVIADIRLVNPVKVERFALFDPDRRPGSTVLVHQQPDNIWRIDYQLGEGEDETEALKEENIRESIRQVLAEVGYDMPWELEWWSIYSANTLCLDDYRDGRIFFIGDSAHIVPIFGVRGFNNGILDGHNIGWKLAYLLNGWAGEGLLDSYTPERRGATLDVFEKSSRSAQFMTPRTRGFRILRDAALSLALDHSFAGQFANPRNMTPYAYSESPLTLPDAGDWPGAPEAGAACPNARLGTGFLLDEVGDHFTVLAFGDVPGLSDEESPRLKVLRLRADGAAAKRLSARAGDAALIRPDHFIAARWHDASAGKIRRVMENILTKGAAA